MNKYASNILRKLTSGYATNYLRSINRPKLQAILTLWESSPFNVTRADLPSLNRGPAEDANFFKKLVYNDILNPVSPGSSTYSFSSEAQTYLESIADTFHTHTEASDNFLKELSENVSEIVNEVSSLSLLDFLQHADSVSYNPASPGYNRYSITEDYIKATCNYVFQSSAGGKGEVQIYVTFMNIKKAKSPQDVKVYASLYLDNYYQSLPHKEQISDLSHTYDDNSAYNKLEKQLTNIIRKSFERGVVTEELFGVLKALSKDKSITEKRVL